ncbi:hypothetical protein ABPG74_001076 [Tetrahymena malaccensis]
MSGNYNHHNPRGRQQKYENFSIQITDSNFKYYCDEVTKHLKDYQYINIEGIGTNIPTAIRVAETFVQRGLADWEKLHTESIEKQNGQKGKKVCIKACIKRK